ncbi:MAG: hypothetical protein EAX86_04805 [Candidatus Heimdallarchaeota archaeon]|nr:hypothetical protein [Candidatus Heimdallarchaeota archaeon]
MIKIYLYGHLKKIFDPNASLAENTIIEIPFKKNETFDGLIIRIGLNNHQIGDCFINGKYAQKTIEISDNSRIGIFPTGMRLIDGGLYIKLLN